MKIHKIQGDISSEVAKSFKDSIAIDTEAMTYHVEGSNPYGVVIKYDNNKVKVIDEISPKHICQTQGWTNSTLLPLTCLPNNIIVVIEAPTIGDVPDDITS